ncbi:hypothetical protein Q5H93_19225 [Hymenobacter sp. ASUV-10]|uniref:Uncharacterized protein n=1 Tax=Hymenobacter aranciens TaxID=3063996 RepID=A0ABT9BF53_9BACT|nr:hypothetical protein [Hymenobacter sp. ASUV-10]MDO7876886.1 hypothetical protein [Hymenobacter sp. ASUV-10]
MLSKHPAAQAAASHLFHLYWAYEILFSVVLAALLLRLGLALPVRAQVTR